MSENKNIPEIIFVDTSLNIIIKTEVACILSDSATETYILKSKYDETLKKIEELEKEIEKLEPIGSNLDLAKMSEQFDEALKNTPPEYFEEISKSVEAEKENEYGWIRNTSIGYVVGIIGLPVQVKIIAFDWENSSVTIDTDYQKGDIPFSNIYQTEAIADLYSR